MGDGEGPTIKLPLPGDSGKAWWGLQLSAVLQLMLLSLVQAGYTAFRFTQLPLLLLAQACPRLSPIAVQATRPCWQPLMR